MKIKSLIARNLTVHANHTGKGGAPFALLFPAGSTLEVSDKEYALVEKQVKGLVKKKVLEITVRPEVTLTVKEILAKVKEDVGVELDSKTKKEELVEQAYALGVEL